MCNPASSLRQCAKKLEALAEARSVSGATWKESRPSAFEATVKPLTRLLVDLNLSCGCWFQLEVRPCSRGRGHCEPLSLVFGNVGMADEPVHAGRSVATPDYLQR